MFICLVRVGFFFEFMDIMLWKIKMVCYLGVDESNFEMDEEL